MRASRNLLRSALATVLVALAATQPSCRAGGDKSVERANDDLRRRVMDLEGQVSALEGRNSELAVKLEESERVRNAALPREVLEAIPRCVALSIGTLSGYEPARGSEPAKVVIDIDPSDALGRFVQIVGTLSVEARALAPVGSKSAEPVVLSGELSPAQVRDAYRGGVLGARYTVELPAEGLPESGDLVMRVKFADALTGRVHTAERTRPVRTEPRRAAGE